MNEKISIQDLINSLALVKNINKREAEDFIRAMFESIEIALKQDRYLRIKGFGTFKVIEVSDRESINVNTGKRIIIEGHPKISFIPEIALRDLFNKPFAHFETVVLNEDVIFEDPSLIDENGREEEEELEELAGDEEDKEDNSDPTDNIEKETDIIKSDNIEKELINTTSTMNKQTKEGLPYFILVLVIIFLMSGSIFLYLYKPEILLSLIPEKKEKVVIPPDSLQTEPASTDMPLLKDTTVTHPEMIAFDEKENKTQLEQLSSQNEFKKEKLKEKTSLLQKESKIAPEPNFKADSVNYIITGTKAIYVLKKGETLTMVSKHFYGTKALWPYILKHNRETIKNPDRVPAGVTLKIPELKHK